MLVAFEEPGPALAKLAQIVSTCPGLISSAYAHEFAGPQDRVFPPFEEVRSCWSRNRAAPGLKCFQILISPPSSASIYQDYRAELSHWMRVVDRLLYAEPAEGMEFRCPFPEKLRR